jgi:hypothetical protein
MRRKAVRVKVRKKERESERRREGEKVNCFKLNREDFNNMHTSSWSNCPWLIIFLIFEINAGDFPSNFAASKASLLQLTWLFSL